MNTEFAGGEKDSRGKEGRAEGTLVVNRVPHQDRIRDQAQATGLVHDLFIVALPELPLVGEEEPLGQALPVFAAVQLQPIAAQFRIVEPAQKQDALIYFANAGQGLGEPIRPAGIGQPLHDGIRRRVPGPQRSGHANQSVPRLADQVLRHASVKQRFQLAVMPVLAQLKESLMAQFGQPGL